MSNELKKSAYDALVHNNGKTFTAKDFKLPEEEDFFQSGLDIGILNQLNQSHTGDMFYIEAPFETEPGYYPDKKAFVLKAQALIPGIDDDSLVLSSRLVRGLNRMDADTFYFINKTIVDGGSSFTIGEKTYSSFRDYVEADKNPNGEFRIRTLGMNAPEVLHYGYLPIKKADYDIHIKTVDLQEAISRGNFLFHKNRDLKANEKIKFYFESEDNFYYEVMDDCFQRGIPELPKYSDHGEQLTYIKFLTVDDTTPETAEVSEKMTDRCIELVKKSVDLRIVVDHKTMNMGSSGYSSPYNYDYYSYNAGPFTNIYKFITRHFDAFFAERRYTRYGYNDPGMDAYKRFLGTVFLKLSISDLKINTSLLEDAVVKDGFVWINLQKYMIMQYQGYAEALPDYNGDPKNQYHDTFVSSAFKLWSYDIVNYENLDLFVANTEEHIDRRNDFYKQIYGLNYEEVLSYYGIIGDTLLMIPPTSIRSVTQVKHDRMPLLRSKGMASNSSPKSEKMVELSLFFNDEEGMNGIPVQVKLPNGKPTVYYMGGLRSLIAQFQLTPFLPIENEYINKILNIEAVSLVSLSVNTVPGYPKLIEAVLTLQEFNYRVYMPELPVPDYTDENSWRHNAFARTINYPVMRWYYQRLLQKGNSFVDVNPLHPDYIEATARGVAPLVPMQFENSKIDFYLPNTEHLDQRLQIAIAQDTKPVTSGMQITQNMKEYMTTLGELSTNFTDMIKGDKYYDLLDSLNKPSTGRLANDCDFMTFYDAVGGKASTTRTPRSFVSVFATNKSGGTIWPKQESQIRDVFYGFNTGWSRDEIVDPQDASVFATVVPEYKRHKAEDFYIHLKNSMSAYGAPSIEEGAVDVKMKDLKEKDKFTYKFSLIVPIPSMMDYNEEKELVTKIKSDLALNESQIFAKTADGQKGVRISWLAEAAKVTDDISLLLEDLRLDMSSPGVLYLQYCKDHEREFAGDQEAQDIQDQNRFETTDAIQFERYYIGDDDLNIQQISCTYINSFSNMSLAAEDGYAHQYCGGQDVAIDIQFTTRSEAAAMLLDGLPRMAAYTVRQYKRILSSWPLRIDSEITKLFGINEVLVESCSTDTVPNHPGVYTIKLRLLGLDRSTRSRESLKKLDLNNSGSSTIGSYELELKNFFDMSDTLAQTEVYPDLMLPTVDELEYDGYRINRYKTGLPSSRIYVDPDFYFNYGHSVTSEVFRKAIIESFKQMTKDFIVSDKYGASSILSAIRDEESTHLTSENGIMLQEMIDQLKEMDKVISYEEYSDLLEHSLGIKTRSRKQIYDVASGLSTPIWSINKKIRFPFREPQFKDTLEIYGELIQSAEDKSIQMIDEILGSSPIKDLPSSVTVKYDFDKKRPSLGIAHHDWFASICKTDITKSANSYIANYDIVDILSCFANSYNGSSEATSTNKSDDSYNTLLNMILAAADTASGETYAYSRSFVTADMGNDEIGDADSWKFRPFLNTKERKPDVDDLALNVRVVIPSEPGIRYARSLREALDYGVAFGAFQIAKLSKQEILTIVNDPDEKRLIEKSDLTGFFVDPYYRNLQLKGGDNAKWQLEKYMTQLIYSPGFGAVAFIRIMLVWYKRLVQDKLCISVYENIRKTALAEYKKRQSAYLPDSSEFPDTWLGHKVESFTGMIAQDANYLMKQLYLEMIYNAYKDDSKKLNDEAFLRDEVRVPEDLIKMVTSNSEPMQGFDEMKKKYQEILDKGADDYTGSDKSSQEMMNLAQLLMNNLKLFTEKHANDLIAQKNLVTSFGTYYSVMTSQFKHEVQLAEKSYEAILEYFNADDNALFLGKGFVTAMLAACGPEMIYPLIQDYNIDVLENIMLTLPVPSNTMDNSLLKKFVLACGQRKVLVIEELGSKLQSAEDLMKAYIVENIYIERSEDVNFYLRDSFMDMIQHDKRGRMVRAFPTYYVMFIDEGREIGLWKIHDNFYNMNAIAEISVTKSRKIAADTAEFTMTNLLKSYTTEEYEIEYYESNTSNVRYNMVDAFNSIFSPRTYYMKEELKRINELPKAKTALKPGIRVHIRLGYGADASELPILFNGVVAEVAAGDLIQIVAQGDGVELMNPIMDMQDTSEIENQDSFVLSRMWQNWMERGVTPREMLTGLMTSKGNWIQKKIRQWSKGRFFNNNPYGIVHFGDPAWKDIFANGETSQNIFEVNPRASWGKDEFVGLEKNYAVKETPRISVSIFGKSFWDLMHIAASSAPEYMTSVVPFGMRSSVFLGAGRYYYAYDYAKVTDDDNSTHIIEKRKPFQQQHIYTSFSDIVANNITATGKNLKTAAIGLYNQNGVLGSQSTKQVGPLYADHDIYPEFQKTMTVDTQYTAKGLPIVGNLFGINAALNKEVGGALPGAKEIAWRMTASALKESMKDMYDGELIVIGDATVKPYDRVWISDVMEHMNGCFEVEAVVHTFSASTGFTTSIYADCISTVDDKYEQYSRGLTQQAVGMAVTGASVLAIAGGFGFRGKPIVGAMADMATKGILGSAGAIGELSKFLGANDKQVANKLLSANDIIRKSIGGSDPGLISLYEQLVGNGTKANSLFTKLAATKPTTVKAMAQAIDDYASIIKDIDLSDYDELLKIVTAQNVGANPESAIGIIDAISQNTKEIHMLATGLLSPDNTTDIKKMIEILNSKDDASKLIAKSLEGIVDGSRAFDARKDLDTITDAIRVIAKTGDSADEITAIAGRLVDSVKDVSVKSAVAATKNASLLDNFVDIFKLAKTNPVVMIVWTVVEFMIWEVIAGFVAEYLERYMQNLQVLQIYPLSKKGKPLVAGVNGHRGSVVGSPTYNDQGEWTSLLTSLFDGKDNGTFWKWTLNQLTSTRLHEISNNLKRQNDYPDAEQIDTDTNRELLMQSFMDDIGQSYVKTYNTNNRYILQEPREDRFDTENAKQYLVQNVITSSISTYPNSVQLEEETISILDNNIIEKFASSNFFSLSPEMSTYESVMTFDGFNTTVRYGQVDDETFNVATLRPDALLLLTDVLSELALQQDHSQKSEIAFDVPEVYLTSATLVNADDWEATGLAFRLSVPNLNLEKAAESVKLKYSKAGIKDCFIIMGLSDEPEHNMIFIMKPPFTKTILKE